MSESFIYWRPPNWACYSRHSLTSDKYRRRVDSLDLLPADFANTNTQDAVCFPSHKVTLLAHVQLLVLQDRQVLFRKAVSQSANPQSVLLHSFIPSQMQDFVFAFVELCEIPVRPFLQAVKVPLNSSDCAPQLGVICTLVENTVCPISQVINDVIKHCCPSTAS